MFANPGAEVLFDCRVEALLGQSARSLLDKWPDIGGDPVRSRQIEAVATRQGGASLPVEASFVTWRHEGAVFAGAVIRSIVDRRVSEAMLEEAQACAAKLEADARAAHMRLAEVIEMQPHGICVLDPDDRYVLWNKNYTELYPEIADVLYPGVRFLDVLRASMANGLPELAEDPEAWLVERLALHEAPAMQREQEMRDGRWLRYDDRRLADGSTIGVRVDITDLKRRESSFRLLFEENPVPMMVIDVGTLAIRNVNDAAVRRYGFSRAEFQSMTVPDLHMHEERDEARRVLSGIEHIYETNTVWYHRNADDEDVAVLMYIRALDLDGRPGLLAALVDVTERVRAEASIAYFAHHDALTGLANRMRFRQTLDAAIDTYNLQGSPFSLVFLDLDGFKPVNDTHGHATGDALLMLVAGRLRVLTRDKGVVARVGGDEFAIVLSQDLTAGEILAARIVDTMKKPFEINGRVLTVGVSVGVAAVEKGCDAELLSAQADAALYEAKACGKNTWRRHDAVRSARRLAEAMRDARPLSSVTGLHLIESLPDEVLPEAAPSDALPSTAMLR